MLPLALHICPKIYTRRFPHSPQITCPARKACEERKMLKPVVIRRRWLGFLWIAIISCQLKVYSSLESFWLIRRPQFVSPLIGDTTKSEIKGQKFNSLEQQRKDRLLHIQRVLSAPSSHANLILSPYSRPNTKVSIRLLYNLYLPLLLARRSRYGEGAPIKFSPKFCTSGWNFKHRTATAAPIEVVWPVVVGEWVDTRRRRRHRRIGTRILALLYKCPWAGECIGSRWQWLSIVVKCVYR